MDMNNFFMKFQKYLQEKDNPIKRDIPRDKSPKRILERGERYIKFKVDNDNIRNIKFIASSRLNVMMSIDGNRTLKVLFKEYAQRVRFLEIHLGKEIIFLYDS